MAKANRIKSLLAMGVNKEELKIHIVMQDVDNYIVQIMLDNDLARRLHSKLEQKLLDLDLEIHIQRQQKNNNVPKLKELTLVTRTCPVCNLSNNVYVKTEGLRKWEFEGYKIQDAFPELTAEQRETLKSGFHNKCWEEVFADLEEMDDYAD